MRLAYRPSFCLPLFTLTLLGLAAFPAQADIASSTFDLSREGWVVGGDATTTNPTFFATGGNPGGFIRTTDTVSGEIQYWIAPSKFLGNVSAAYNNNLTFDLQQSSANAQFEGSDVMLIGGGMTLVYDTPINPAVTPAWTSYSVLLTEVGWKKNTLAGAAASQADFQTVLSSLTSLRIRAEYRSGSDIDGLDNVVLNGTAAATPEPGLTALLAGLAVSGSALGLRRSRRNKSRGHAGE